MKPNQMIVNPKKFEVIPATELTFICSNSTIETLEKRMKYVQS